MATNTNSPLLVIVDCNVHGLIIVSGDNTLVHPVEVSVKLTDMVVVAMSAWFAYCTSVVAVYVPVIKAAFPVGTLNVTFELLEVNVKVNGPMPPLTWLTLIGIFIIIIYGSSKLWTKTILQEDKDVIVCDNTILHAVVVEPSHVSIG